MPTCEGCRAYVMERRASSELSRHYGHETEAERDKRRLAAALMARSEAICLELRASGCCQINPQAGAVRVEQLQQELNANESMIADKLLAGEPVPLELQQKSELLLQRIEAAAVAELSA